MENGEQLLECVCVCVCVCVHVCMERMCVQGSCWRVHAHVAFLRDDRQISSRTQAHTLACTVQIHTSLLLYTHRGCVVMQLLHLNYM